MLARFGADGTLAWAAGRAAQAYDGLRGVALASTGAVYATGWFGATAVFGAGQPTETTLVAGGDADVFLARYEASGAFGWVRQPQGADRDEGAAVALTPDGTGVVLTGRYAWPASGSGSGTITFGAGRPGAVTLTSVDRGAAFVAGYATDGAFDGWARSAGGSGGGSASG